MKFPSKTSLVIWSLLLWGVWSFLDYYGATEYFTRAHHVYYKVTIDLNYQDKPIQIKAVVDCSISYVRPLGGSLDVRFDASPDIVGKRLDDGSGVFIIPNQSDLCAKVYRNDDLSFDDEYETVFLESVPRIYWVKDYDNQDYAEIYLTKSSYTSVDSKFKNAKLAISTATDKDYTLFRKEEGFTVASDKDFEALPIKNLYCIYALSIHNEGLFEQNNQLKSLLQTSNNSLTSEIISISADKDLRNLVHKITGGSGGSGPRIFTAVFGLETPLMAVRDPKIEGLIDQFLLPFRLNTPHSLVPRNDSKIVSCVPASLIRQNTTYIDFGGLNLSLSDYESKYYIDLKGKTLTTFFGSKM